MAVPKINPTRGAEIKMRSNPERCLVLEPRVTRELATIPYILSVMVFSDRIPARTTSDLKKDTADTVCIPCFHYTLL